MEKHVRAHLHSPRQIQLFCLRLRLTFTYRRLERCFVGASNCLEFRGTHVTCSAARSNFLTFQKGPKVPGERQHRPDTTISEPAGTSRDRGLPKKPRRGRFVRAGASVSIRHVWVHSILSKHSFFDFKCLLMIAVDSIYKQCLLSILIVQRRCNLFITCILFE